ncbi:MAG: hypothetical protein DRH11_14380 [Deltaproteobacteria bacterium]|nr:MAG: hypothetical protein DRH11_14380 [Deltaproteobacteria bacterium]
MPEEIFDVVVIGGGAGGVPAAIRAAQLGGRVALVEEKHLGGLCMNRGCIPFGNMMAAVHILDMLSLGKEMGISCAKKETDFSAVQKRQKKLIQFMRLGTQGVLRKNKVSLISGRGELVDRGSVRVNGDLLKCRKIILATGGRWLKPDIPGSDLDGVVNSDYLLHAKKPPGRALLLGDSPMLIEIAQFLHRFGSKTTLATGRKRLLEKETKTISSRLTKVLKNQGLQLRTTARVQALAKEKGGLRVSLESKKGVESLTVDCLITLKRGASMLGLGLDKVGLDEGSPYIRVNDRMETDADDIYAIGDLSAPEEMHFSHMASAGGIVAAENAMGLGSSLCARTIARVLFTSPQVACVGLTAKEAKESGYDVVMGAAPLSMNPCGMILSQNEGIVEIVAERKYGEILGIHIIGEAACEMAGQAVMAVQMEVTLEEMAKLAFPHPTLSESLAEAARECLGRPIYLP